jgi:uncharacterized membrane protein HdeD (DUF308 family)
MSYRHSLSTLDRVNRFDSTSEKTDDTIAPVRRTYLIRGLIALVWAAGFAASSHSLGAAAVALLIGYPIIDVVASVVDARGHRGTPIYPVQVMNAAISTLATIALIPATISGAAAVLHVFGVWATVSGIVQLVVVVRRRAQLGAQWLMLLSGALSTLAGIFLNVSATAVEPSLAVLAPYAALGGLLFIGSAVVITLQARDAA